MKYIRILSKLVLMCMAVTATSCQDDIELPNDIGTEDYGDCYFILDNGSSPTSRATYNDIENTVFDEGDIVGVFGLDSEGNLCDEEENIPYVVSVIAGTLGSDGTITPSTKRTLKPSTGREVKKNRAKYLFYYPYSKDMTLEKAKQLTHTVKGDQTKKEAYEASDLLWDVASPSDGGRYCHIVMEHAMANIIIVLDHKFYNKDKGIRISGVNTTASDVNLLTPELENMSYATDNYEESLLAWSFGQDARGSSVFRIAVPAQTIPGGSSTGAKSYFITATSSDGDIKTFKLRSDLVMKPGHNYIFQLTINAVPIQDYGDDDSWVLDVVDPDNGQLVGLLCREYIRYQPQYDHGEVLKEKPTSPQNAIYRDELTSDSEPRINSQCWVFYNLEDDGKTPDLTHGTILRLIYDVRTNLGDSDDDDLPTYGYMDKDENGNEFWNPTTIPGGRAWPSPYKLGDGINADIKGLYLAKHGYRWGYDASKQCGTSIGERQYYMHGTEIYWDGREGVNKIEYVVLPRKEASATNEEAYWQGHIAIPKDGKPYVSYSPLDYGSTIDSRGERVGFTIPHHLVDIRTAKNGKVETERYPLVKIGFNQFWMSKSFRGRTLQDGTPLKCINNPEGGHYMPNKDDWNAPRLYDSYYYPETDYLLSDGQSHRYDPMKVHNESEQECIDIGMVPGYNHTAFYNDKLIPISVEGVAEYVRPTEEIFDDFKRYVSWLFSLKMMSSDVITYWLPETQAAFTEDKFFQACDKGTYIIPNHMPYPGNISGLNLNADGGISQMTGLPKLCSDACMWIYVEDMTKYGCRILDYHPWDTWETDAVTFLNGGNYYKYDPNASIMPNAGVTQCEFYWTLTFAPVRYLLQFKVWRETCNIPRSRSMAQTTRHVSRNVYVGVDECKSKNVN